MIDRDADREAIAEYCRRVEDHLTRVNAGHLVRIVGPGFERVRRWAELGVPLSVVFRGIELKAERHQEGASRRPLRIEFCADDVEKVFEQWRRAVGVNVLPAIEQEAGSPEEGARAEGATVQEDAKRPSLKRHLDRAFDRLSRALGRVDLPEPLRDACDPILQRLAALREESKGARGAARENAEEQLAALDRALGDAAASLAAPDVVAAAAGEAMADLSPFRSRLAPADFDRAFAVTRDRLIRGRYGLPHLTL